MNPRYLNSPIINRRMIIAIPEDEREKPNELNMMKELNMSTINRTTKMMIKLKNSIHVNPMSYQQYPRIRRTIVPQKIHGSRTIMEFFILHHYHLIHIQDNLYIALLFQAYLLSLYRIIIT